MIFFHKLTKKVKIPRNLTFWADLVRCMSSLRKISVSQKIESSGNSKNKRTQTHD